MLLSADVMRALLVLCLAGMALLAAFYLRRRRLTFTQYLGWGLLAILLPILGPFLVILSQPGRPAHHLNKLHRHLKKHRPLITDR